MKKKMIVAGFLAASIIMVMFLSPAVAFSDVYITYAGQGRIWQFAPKEDEGEVTDVSAYYILVTTPPNNDKILIPIKQKAITNNLVTLVFDLSDLPDLEPTDFTTGVHVTADQPYDVTGPGFAWGRTR